MRRMAKTSIRIQIGEEEYDAFLDDSHSPQTVEKVLEALPVETSINTWGEEFYFRIPVEAGEENGKPVVSIGDLAFWPQGSAFCIFFGRTPMSRNDEEIVPASPVNLLGRIEGAERLKGHRDGERVRITSA